MQNNRHIVRLIINGINYFFDYVNETSISFTKRDDVGKLLDVPKNVNYIIDEKTQTVKADTLTLSYDQFSFIMTLLFKKD